MIRALVPAKALGEAKGRLSSVLSDVERRKLALAMLEDVVRALKAVAAIESVSVVSPDSDVLGLAAKLDASPVAESANVRGLNQALARALSSMSPKPEALLIVLGDVPEATAGDIETLLAALPERGVAPCPSADRGTSAPAFRPPGVIAFRCGCPPAVNHQREAIEAGVAADRVRADALAQLVARAEGGGALRPAAGRGTGARALRPPDGITFRFGERASVNHKREAMAIGVPAEVVRIESLAHDVDSPEDLRRLLARPGETATHRLLAELGVEERLE